MFQPLGTVFGPGAELQSKIMAGAGRWVAKDHQTFKRAMCKRGDSSSFTKGRLYPSAYVLLLNFHLFVKELKKNNSESYQVKKPIQKDQREEYWHLNQWRAFKIK